MGQRIITEVFDDLDGVPGDDVVTMTFACQGVTYEIDLGPGNAKRLNEALREFIGAARVTTQVRKFRSRGVPPPMPKLPPGEASKLPRTTKDGESIEQLARAWAVENRIPVANRGRIYGSVVKQFIEAHPELLPDLDVENDS